MVRYHHWSSTYAWYLLGSCVYYWGLGRVLLLVLCGRSLFSLSEKQGAVVVVHLGYGEVSDRVLINDRQDKEGVFLDLGMLVKKAIGDGGESASILRHMRQKLPSVCP
jgi:hypothetical protein